MFIIAQLRMTTGSSEIIVVIIIVIIIIMRSALCATFSVELMSLDKHSSRRSSRLVLISQLNLENEGE